MGESHARHFFEELLLVQIFSAQIIAAHASRDRVRFTDLKLAVHYCLAFIYLFYIAFAFGNYS